MVEDGGALVHLRHWRPGTAEPTGQETTVRRNFSTVAACVATLVLVVAAPTTATAATSNHPAARASCVGQIFQPQAVSSPGAIARRIAEIQGFIDVPFGTVIGDLARWDDCSPD